MGTRNLNCIFQGNDFAVAKYCQWDGYPEGQGVGYLDFLRQFKTGKRSLDEFKEMVKRVKEPAEGEVQAVYKSLGADDSGWVSCDIADKFKQLRPEWSRDMGSEILDTIWRLKGEVSFIKWVEFAKDSLFCEWAYVVDLNDDSLEVYRGFVTNELPAQEHGKFAFPGYVPEKPEHSDTTYWPIRIVAKYPIAELPTKRQFVADLSLI